ncbi:hypothetical protein GUITHDRAFT_156605 [Guillardia theta CCMP2712]|uniref:Uncharacterized protein n=2 Tax=Guillardia theta TaxID=55529 RepID=L1I695_GUITC|nr:hypothetical protein GUITHDRAFT_156605 [Guillardia theta CCMP2712]EKX31399.1 hypothetical protein GUITHDRAFT_156605 [Guillardia theta CCMP2712]|eukprot:XP_005818379.1 hypothetical protein GUITHDRAFT_156605 [Guillardia theta CCMP2712]
MSARASLQGSTILSQDGSEETDVRCPPYPAPCRSSYIHQKHRQDLYRRAHLAKVALDKKIAEDERADKQINVPAHDLGEKSRGLEISGNMTMSAIVMMCLFVGCVTGAVVQVRAARRERRSFISPV